MKPKKKVKVTVSTGLNVRFPGITATVPRHKATPRERQSGCAWCGNQASRRGFFSYGVFGKTYCKKDCFIAERIWRFLGVGEYPAGK